MDFSSALEVGSRISLCPNNHFFLGEICPHCRRPVMKMVPMLAGDCVKCGYLCAAGLYCCSDEDPIVLPDSLWGPEV